MALGAPASDIFRLVIRQGLYLALAGVAAGLPVALFGTRAISGALFGVSPTDLSTFLGIAALLVGVALVASFVPARRATRLDPIAAVRHE